MKQSRFGIALLALIVAVATACAAPPPLSVPPTITVSAGSFVAIPAATPGKTVQWVLLDPGLSPFPQQLLTDTHTAVYLCPQPGSYRVLAITAAGDEVSAPALCTVVVTAGASPAPTPSPPNPAPTPSPTPSAAKPAWAVVVVDNNARTGPLGRLITSPSLFSALRSRGVEMRVFDVSDPQLEHLNYANFLAEAGGAPALIVLTAEGKRVKSIRIPADEATFLSAIGPSPAASHVLKCGPGGCHFILEVKP